MRYFSILFIIGLVFILFQTALGQGFSVSPSRLIFSGNPGETVTQLITFSNSSPNPLSFINRIQDWDRDSLGNKRYYDRNTRPLSNAASLSLSSNTTVMNPGEMKQVIVSMTIPDDAKKLTHSMVFFTQVKEQRPAANKGTSIGIEILMEVGVQIYYEPKGLSPGEFEFLAFDDHGIVDLNGTKTRRLVLKIHNKSEINKDAAMRFEFTNKDTGEEFKLKPEVIAMLPDATQSIIMDLPTDLKGTFLAVALLDAGSTYDLKVAEKEVTYRP